MYLLTMTIEKRRVSRGQVTAAKRGHSWSASLWAEVVRQGNALRSTARWAMRREPDALRSNIGIKLTCYTRREQKYLDCVSPFAGVASRLGPHAAYALSVRPQGCSIL